MSWCSSSSWCDVSDLQGTFGVTVNRSYSKCRNALVDTAIFESLFPKEIPTLFSLEERFDSEKVRKDLERQDVPAVSMNC